MSFMYKNNPESGEKNELRHDNDNGRARIVQVTRMTGLMQPFKITGPF